MNSRNKKRSRLLFSVLAAAMAMAVVPACAKRKPKEINPITVKFEVNRSSAPLGSYVEATYTWTCEPGMKKITGDYRAFVHFLGDKKSVLFGDDHVPIPPVSSWEPGKTYSYRRPLFIPPVPHVGDVRVLMGLYDPQGRDSRIALKGEDSGNQAYKVAQMELVPQTENIYVINKSGWHNTEIDPERPGVETTWTKKEAIAQIKNPNMAGSGKKEDLIVYLEADTNSKAFPQTPVMTVTIGASGFVIPIQNSELFFKRLRFKADQIGDAEWLDLKLAMNQSFVPKSLGMNDDDRELGIRIHHLFVVEASQVGDLTKGDVTDAGLLPAATPAIASRKAPTVIKRK
jgi:hypothetical protein